VRQVAAEHPSSIDELLVDERMEERDEFASFPLRVVTESQLRKIALSRQPQGIIAVLRIPPDIYSDKIPTSHGERIILLEDVQDPGNVGTLIRTAAAFGFSGVILSTGSADPLAPKTAQASAGALFQPWIRRTDNYLDLVRQLMKQKYRLYCTRLSGTRQVDFGVCRKLILAFGNEGSGLSEKLLNMADESISIPMNTTAVQSLNVAVSGAICMFAVFRNGGWQDE
jgi:TrmH family RNA methyltransferase